MRKSESKDLCDGLRITVAQLPPRKGFKMAAKLFKLLAPALGAMEPNESVDLASLQPALMGLLRDIDDDELMSIMSGVFDCAYVVRTNDKGDPAKYELNDGNKIDAAFEGKLPEMFQAVMFAIEVNFADFFSGDAPSGEAKSSS